MTDLNEKALEAARKKYAETARRSCVEAGLADAIRAYLTSATPPDVAGLIERLEADVAEQRSHGEPINGSLVLEAATALRLSAGGGASQAARDVLAERRRQIEAEGWTPEHDDEHTDFSLARAAAAYAYGSSVNQIHRSVIDAHGLSGVTHFLKSIWPETWAWKWFKPTNRRRDLVKAGALILAEVERIDRLPASPTVEAGR